MECQGESCYVCHHQLLLSGINQLLTVEHHVFINRAPCSLTGWGWVTHIYVSKNKVIIGSDNVLSLVRWQANIFKNGVLFLNGPLETNSSEIRIKRFCIEENIRIFRRQDGGHFVQASVYVLKCSNYYLFNIHFINSTILWLVVIITVVSEPWPPDYVMLSYWNTNCYGCVIIIQLRICVCLWHKRRLNPKSWILNHDRLIFKSTRCLYIESPRSLVFIRVVVLPKPFI